VWLDDGTLVLWEYVYRAWIHDRYENTSGWAYRRRP